MDDWEYNNTEDDYWSDTGNEANPDTYTPTQPVDDNYWDDTGNVTNPDSYDNTGGDYTGYTPGYENPNLTPAWYSNMLGSGGSTSQLLGSIFGGNNTSNLIKGGAALVEGMQNKKKAAALSSIANSASIDPWASQRPFYQQQAQSAVTDPYSSPIVAA